jgi:hypothetical protein
MAYRHSQRHSQVPPNDTNPLPPSRAHEAAEEEEGDSAPIPSPGFPTREAVRDYCRRQGWPVHQGDAFWLHYDERRSNGDAYVGGNWHWWSRLEKWVMDEARGSIPGRAAPPRPASPGRASRISDYDRPEDWTDDNQTL